MPGCCDGKIEDNGVRRLLSEDRRLSFEDLLSDFSSICLLTSLSFFRCSLTVFKPCSSQRTDAVELLDEARESVEVSETGLKDDSLERTESDRLRLRMLAESAESRLAMGAMDEEALGSRTAGRRIVLGKPSPRMLCFLGPMVFGASGLAVSPPNSKLLVESRTV